MKKFACAILMLIMVFSFAGCGNGGNSDDIGKIESYNYILSDNSSTNYDQGYAVFCLKEGAYIDDIDVCFMDLKNGTSVSIGCKFWTDWGDYRLPYEYYPKGTRFFVNFTFNSNVSSDYCIKVSGRKITDGKVAAETTVIYTEEFSFNF